jgi:hypothetical protein
MEKIMTLRVLLIFSCYLFAVCSAQGQTVLVCTMEKGAFAKVDEQAKLVMQLQDEKGEKLRVVFSGLDTVEPVFKVKNVEKKLTLLRRDSDLIWLRDSTNSTIGEGVLVWMVDLKARIVVRSESLRTTKIKGEDWSGAPMAILEIGRCE